MEITKYCSKCDTTKPIEQFCKYKRSADGHSWTCKTCVKEYQLANKEKMKAYQRDYQLKYKVEHGEKLREYTRTYLKTVGKESHTAYLNKWRAANPEKVKEYVRISRERIKAKKQLNDQ